MKTSSFLDHLPSPPSFQYLKYQLFHESRVIQEWIGLEPLVGGQKFSIIVPLYGIPLRWMQAAFKSIEAQSYPNWEVCVCVDGEDVSGLGKLLRDFENRQPAKLKVIRHESNKGICEATRSAMGLASGEYLVFMDGDDLLHRRALECFARAVEHEEDIDMLYSDHDLMSERGVRLFPFVKPGLSPETLLHVNYFNHLTVARRSIVESIPELFASETQGSQDWDVCLRMLRKSRRVRHIPLPLYHWRTRKGSVALSGAEKPWAYDAALRVRQSYARTISPELDFDRTKNTLVFAKRPATSATKILLPTPLSTPTTHSVRRVLESLSQAARAASNPQQALWLQDPTQPELPGTGVELQPYLKIAKLGAVWPFRRPGVRTGYTLSPRGDSLVALNPGRHTTSYCSGNILTGPLHGMMIRAALLARVTQALLSGENDDLLEHSFCPNQLGALIGLKLLDLGYRNASVDALICPRELPEITFPIDALPECDPYA